MKKRIRSMEVAGHQGDSWPAVVVTGDVGRCHCLREAVPEGGNLIRVGKLTGLGTLDRTPLFTDKLGDRIYLFTQEDDGTLYVEGYTDAEGTHFTAELTELTVLTEPVSGMAVVGNFLVIRTESGRLEYVYRDPQTPGYQWLGTLPDLPEFTVSPHLTMSRSAQVGAISFKNTIPVGTRTIPTWLAERVDTEVRAAWTRAADDLHAQGFWIEPVSVRVAMRLWDDTLLNVSEPVLCNPVTRRGSVRVNLPLAADEVKLVYTGTQQTTFTVSGYSLKVTLQSTLPAEWAGVVKGLEIWVSRDVESLDPDVAANVVANAVTSSQGTAGNYLNVLLPLRGASAVDALVPLQPMGMLKFTDGTQGVVNLLNRTSVEYTDAIGQYLEQMPGLSGGAGVNALLGYGGFLHAAVGSDLYTSRRENPFVLQSHTAGLGGTVRSLMPQVRGGGAFTRQYIYVSTEAGIIAVNHDSRGGHTNARPLTPQTLRDDGQWLPTTEGVYALMSDGSLARLRDAQVATLLTGTRKVARLLWSYGLRELWLATDAEGSVVFQTRAGDRAFTRPESPRCINPLTVPGLVYTRADTGVCTLYNIERETSQGADSVEYEVTLPIPARKGAPRSLEMVFGTHRNLNCRVTADYWPGFPVMRATVAAVPLRRMSIPFTLPAAMIPDTPLHVELEGNIPSLQNIRVI